jgi:hypothetical protein
MDLDPRWTDDPRDRDDYGRELNHGSRGGLSKPRERERLDTRDVFTRDLQLLRGPERERVWARDSDVRLRGSEVRSLATVGAFRVVPAGDLRDGQNRPLDPHRGDLRHLRDSGLVETIPARRALKNGDRRVRVPIRLTDETDESISEGLREFGEVYGLEPVSALLQRRVFRRQERTKNRRIVFGADLVVQDAVVDRDEPPFARPVRTGGAEVGPVCALPVTTPIALMRVSQNENTTSPGDTSRMFS